MSKWLDIFYTEECAKTIKIVKNTSNNQNESSFGNYDNFGKQYNIKKNQNIVCSKTSDLRYGFEERAAILEFDGGFTVEEAEKLSYQEAIKEFIKDNYSEIVKQFEDIIYSK